MKEKLEILADGKEIEVEVEREDMDAAAGAPCVEDHGERVLGRKLAAAEIGGRNLSGHDVEDGGQEEKRDGDEEDETAVLVELVREGVTTPSSSARTLEHLVVGEGIVLMIGRRRIGRDQILSLKQFSRRRRSVTDLLPFLVCRLQIWL